MSNTVFPGRNVISWYESVEALLDDVLTVIPFEPSHLTVWSPKLTTVLLETCSQLDSLWKHEALLLPDVTGRRLTIKDYFKCFGPYLAPRWVVFWGDEPKQLSPFKPWQSAKVFDPPEYDSCPLAWWQAYNSLKHSRIQSRRNSQLRYAVEAVAALFLAILRSKHCHAYVAEAGWLKSSSQTPSAALDEDINDTSSLIVCAESKLLSYPVSGWRLKWKRQGLRWTGPASERFRSWYEAYEVLPSSRDQALLNPCDAQQCST